MVEEEGVKKKLFLPLDSELTKDVASLKSEADFGSVDSEHSSADSSESSSGTFSPDGKLKRPPEYESSLLIGSFNISEDKNTDAKENDSKKYDINEISTKSVALHHLYLSSMCMAYARWRETHKGSMNEVHSSNIETFSNANLDPMENRPYPARIWDIWLSMKKTEESPLLCDVVIDSIQQDISDSSYIYIICRAPQLDMVTVVFGAKEQRNFDEKEGSSYYRYKGYDGKTRTVGVNNLWGNIIGKDGSLVNEILLEVKRHRFSHLSFVGYGGGGALATICSLWACRLLTNATRVFSFGCPPIGDAAFEQVHDELHIQGYLEHLRFVNSGDSIAKQPRRLRISSGFKSVGFLIILKGGNFFRSHNLETYWKRLQEWKEKSLMVDFSTNVRREKVSIPRWVWGLAFQIIFLLAIYVPILFLTLYRPVPCPELLCGSKFISPKLKDIIHGPEWIKARGASTKNKDMSLPDFFPEGKRKSSIVDSRDPKYNLRKSSARDSDFLKNHESNNIFSSETIGNRMIQLTDDEEMVESQNNDEEILGITGEKNLELTNDSNDNNHVLVKNAVPNNRDAPLPENFIEKLREENHPDYIKYLPDSKEVMRNETTVENDGSAIYREEGKKGKQTENYKEGESDQVSDTKRKEAGQSNFNIVNIEKSVDYEVYDAPVDDRGGIVGHESKKVDFSSDNRVYSKVDGKILFNSGMMNENDISSNVNTVVNSIVTSIKDTDEQVIEDKMKDQTQNNMVKSVMSDEEHEVNNRDNSRADDISQIASSEFNEGDKSNSNIVDRLRIKVDSAVTDEGDFLSDMETGVNSIEANTKDTDEKVIEKVIKHQIQSSTISSEMTKKKINFNYRDDTQTEKKAQVNTIEINEFDDSNINHMKAEFQKIIVDSRIVMNEDDVSSYLEIGANSVESKTKDTDERIIEDRTIDQIQSSTIQVNGRNANSKDIECDHSGEIHPATLNAYDAHVDLKRDNKYMEVVVTEGSEKAQKGTNEIEDKGNLSYIELEDRIIIVSPRPMRFVGFRATKSFQRRPSLGQSPFSACYYKTLQLRSQNRKVESIFNEWETLLWYKKYLSNDQQAIIEATDVVDSALKRVEPIDRWL